MRISVRGMDAVDRVEHLWKALFVHHRAIASDTEFVTEQVSWERCQGHYANWLAEPGAALLLAERGSEVVAYAMVRLITEPDDVFAHPLPLGHLETLSVAPSERGGGVGTQLFHLAEKELAAAGAAGLTIDVVAGNTGAQRLYERHGVHPLVSTLATARGLVAEEGDDAADGTEPPSTDIGVRVCGAEALDALAPLWSARAAHFRALRSDVPLVPDAESWSRRRAHYASWLGEQGSHVLLAERAGTLIGYAFVHVTKAKAGHRVTRERVARIATLAVAPGEPAADVGAALMHAAGAELAALDIVDIEAATLSNHVESLRTFARFGLNLKLVELARLT